jgi:hypothetical protein
VIATHGKRALADKVHDGLDSPFRIGAIADVVTKADGALRPPRAREIEARRKRLTVGMDIREKCQQHGFPPRRPYPPRRQPV